MSRTKKKKPIPTDLRCHVPAGTSGIWTVEKFTVTKEDAAWESVRSVVTGCFRGATEGNFTGLSRSGSIIMSDTRDEMRDLWPLATNAKGHVLIMGLGLGMAVRVAFECGEAERVTVIELSEDVIKLSAPTYQKQFGDRFQIVHADAYAWRPAKGERFGAVWHDIWDNISEDNLEGMGRLHRIYGRRTDWQDSWCRDRCLWQRDRSRRSGW